jgi:hypothetical protein
MYYQNEFRKEQISSSRFYYSLSWQYEFQAEETVYFAYCFPYTYSQLVKDLDLLLKDPVRSKFIERSTLFTTLSGNKGELLTITDPSGTEAEQ